MDIIKAQGDFNLKVYSNGELVSSFEERNLVVNLGKKNLARLLCGDVSGKKVEKISVGTSSTAPAGTDSTITGAFTKAIESCTFPSDNSVTFHFDIANTEANGITIREFGLLNTDNVLFARKVRTGEIIKTSAIRLVGTWTITIN